MASVVNDIKNKKIAGMYLFYGEEAFKKRNFKELLKKEILNGNDINYSEFSGKDIDWQAVYDSVVTMPFFAERRLVVIENSGKFKAGKGNTDPENQEDRSSAIIEKILNECPAATCLAFFEEEAAKNKRIYKIIAGKGQIAECSADNEDNIINWLARGFAKEGKKVRKSTLELLTGRIGLDYDRLRGEFEKIISYVGDREVIEDSDIMEITSENIESKIFDMLDAVSGKNVSRVLELYYDMLANKEPALYILAMLRSQFRTMLQVSELYSAGLSQTEIAKTAGKQGFVVKKSLRYIKRFSSVQIEKILEEISDTDMKCKSGEIQDQIGVELLLIRFSG